MTTGLTAKQLGAVSVARSRGSHHCTLDDQDDLMLRIPHGPIPCERSAREARGFVNTLLAVFAVGAAIVVAAVVFT